VRALTLLVAGGLALAALGARAASADAWDQGEDVTPPEHPAPAPEEADNAILDIAMQTDPQAAVAAFLAAIRHFESRGDYSILYGGARFDDFSRHPRTPVPINLPGYEGKFSTAAGAYQINWPTYQDFAPRLGIADFSPASQDALALAILKSTGAYDAILEGDIEAAFRLASRRWASLPGSTANQRPQTLTAALDYFNSVIGA